MVKKFIKDLQYLHILKISKNQKLRCKKRLLEKIHLYNFKKPSIFAFGKDYIISLFRISKIVSTSIIALLVVFLIGIAAVNASFSSLPGDILYPVKLKVERIQLLFIKDPSKEVEKRIELVKKRVQETQIILVKKEQLPKEKVKNVKDVMENVSKEIDVVNKKLEEVKKVLNDKAIDRIKQIKQTTDEIKQKLKDTVEKLPEADGETKETEQKIKEAIDKVTDTKLKSLEVIVDKAYQNKTDLKDEVKQVIREIEDEIIYENSTATSSSPTSTQFSDSVDFESSTTSDKVFKEKSLDKEIDKLEDNLNGIELDKIQDQKQTQKTESNQIIDKIKEVVKGSLEEAEKLTNQGKLKEALEKIKIGKEVAKFMEKEDNSADLEDDSSADLEDLENNSSEKDLEEQQTIENQNTEKTQNNNQEEFQDNTKINQEETSSENKESEIKSKNFENSDNFENENNPQ